MKKIYLSSLALMAGLAVQAQTVTYHVKTLSGVPGEEGWAPMTTSYADAKLYSPFGITVDDYDRVWITEGGPSGMSNRVRAIDFGTSSIYNKSGAGTDPATTATQGYENATGNVARYNSPHGILFGKDGKFYIADAYNHVIRTHNGVGSNIGNGNAVTTFAGPAAPNGVQGYADGAAGSARFSGPVDITMDGAGNLYVIEMGNFCIRKITPGGVVSTLAGDAGTDGDADGAAATARFGALTAITMFDNTNLLVCDAGNNKIRMVNINSGNVSTMVGQGASNPGNVDGPRATAKLHDPTGIAVDSNGVIYFSEGGTSGFSNVIRIMRNDTVYTIAGKYQEMDQFRDGDDTASRFYKPGHMAFSSKQDTLYIVDMGTYTVRKMYFTVTGDPGNPSNLAQVNNIKMNAYPNPSNGTTHVSFTSNSNKTHLHLFDAKGQLIDTRVFESGTHTSTYQNLTKGIYFVRAIDAEGNIQNIKISVN